MTEPLRRWAAENHAEVMAGIKERGQWMLATMNRSFRWTLVIMITCGIVGCVAVWLEQPWLGSVLVIVPGALAMITHARRTHPERLQRQWNDDHGAVGAYLAKLDEDAKS